MLEYKLLTLLLKTMAFFTEALSMNSQILKQNLKQALYFIYINIYGLWKVQNLEGF